MASNTDPIVIGAGPAGLTAGLQLVSRGVRPRIYEATGTVGGLAGTSRDGDWRVDSGGHRFFTRSAEVLELWNSLLPPEQWLTERRRSAMFVDDRYVQYPLVGRDLLTQLGIRRGARGLGSLAWARLRRWRSPLDPLASFREWGTREFGRYWYDLFFDGYVRKTWRTDPEGIASDWANQRIKPIDWRLRASDPGHDDEFRYPRLGPGQLWEAAAAALADAGFPPALNSRVVALRFDGGRWAAEMQDGEVASGDAVFSSMPLRLFVGALEPTAPKSIRAAAATLKHRGLITVAVALKTHVDVPYHWVYTPGSGFHAGRIQNYGLWSSALAPAEWLGTFLGLEYFVGADGELMAAADEHLYGVLGEDLRALGVDDDAVEHVMIVRSPFAYPIGDRLGNHAVGQIRDYLRREYPTLHPIGRNGMHHYDNQDHAMLTAMRSVARYFGEDVDPWQVNTDRRYHEAGLLRR